MNSLGKLRTPPREFIELIQGVDLTLGQHLVSPFIYLSSACTRLPAPVCQIIFTLVYNNIRLFPNDVDYYYYYYNIRLFPNDIYIYI